MKEFLLYLFQTTGEKASWFAPLQPSLEGLTDAQARWKPNWSDHSVAGITAHLHFYHERELMKFQGNEVKDNSGENALTFNEPPEGKWTELVKNTHSVLQAWQQEIRQADEAKLASSAFLLGELSTHLAYHTGQIVLLRKCQGSWNPDNGVQ